MPRRRESKGGTLAADHRGGTETVGHSMHPYAVTQEVTGAVPGKLQNLRLGRKKFHQTGEDLETVLCARQERTRQLLL